MQYIEITSPGLAGLVELVENSPGLPTYIRPENGRHVFKIFRTEGENSGEYLCICTIAGSLLSPPGSTLDVDKPDDTVFGNLKIELGRAWCESLELD